MNFKDCEKIIGIIMSSNQILSYLCCLFFALSCPINAKASDEIAANRSKHHLCSAFKKKRLSKKNNLREHKRPQKTESFGHNIQLQLYDSLDVPVDGTQFWVTLKILKEGQKVTISLPIINFQTDSTSPDDPYHNVLPGGTIRTSDGFLPKGLRPLDPVYRTFSGSSNNGQSLAFSYADNPLPNPIVGYNLSITIGGELVIQGAGTFGALIPPGPQVLMPTDISYIIEPSEKLCKNFVLSKGASNITQFTGGPFGAAGSAYRDHHVNDAFDDVVAWTWTDNSMIANKANNTVNVMVRIGKIKNGKLKLRKPIQLTDLPPGIYAWDTAVAINPTNKDNIVVSYAVLNEPSTPHRAVSFDGGKTWPDYLNGPTNIQPTGPFKAGDNRGIAADKFGNFWYSTTNFKDDSGNTINQPTFWISSDGGVTFSVAYTAPLPSNLGVDFYDFPQYCFGGDGQGNYGLWYSVDYFTTPTGIYPNIIPVVGFIPITGLGSYDAGTTEFLYSLLNTQQVCNIAASEDGRVWTSSYVNLLRLIIPSVIRFKSPGPIDRNYAGPWQVTITNILASIQTTGLPVVPPITTQISFPEFGYFNSIRSLLYDEKRQALYLMFANQVPDQSQNMRIYLLISRNNGQSWSDPLYISTSNFANRGFPTMALDSKNGNLVFGWLDGRNDPTFKSVQYFGAILPAKTLDKLVNQIPLSNPLFSLPPATQIPPGGIGG